MSNFQEIQGGAELDRKLQLLGKNAANKLMKKGLKAGAQLIAKEVKKKAPVLTGTLKKSIKVKTSKKKRGKKEIGFNVGFDTKKYPQLVAYAKGASSSLKTKKTTGKRYFYPAAIEYGTKNMEPKPFIRPAFNHTKGDAVRAIIKTTSDELLKVAGI